MKAARRQPAPEAPAPQLGSNGVGSISGKAPEPEMDPEAADQQLRRHLERNGLLEPGQPTCWKIERSELSMRFRCNALKIYGDVSVLKI